jgi:hypothetical protein
MQETRWVDKAIQLIENKKNYYKKESKKTTRNKKRANGILEQHL